MKRIFLLLLLCGLSSSGMEVTFANVGQGNCTLVTVPGQIPLLVDAGSSKKPIDGSSLETTIKTIIKKIEQASDDKQLFVIVSHADKDHINKIAQICTPLLKKKFSIEFLLGGSPEFYTKEDGKKLLAFINKNTKSCKKQFVSDTQKDKRGEKFKEILPPYCQVLAANTDKKLDPNDTSIVIKVADENFSVLLPGDATGNVMNPLTNNNAALSKATAFELSHHGASSHDSNTTSQLNIVNPESIIISSGLLYNHPRFEVMKAGVEYCMRKKLNNAPFHMLTYQHGNVIPAFKGNEQTRFNLVAVNNDGFCTAQTSHPIYHTSDSGTITYSSQGITVSNESSTHEDRGIGALTGIQTPRFDGIRFLFFNNMEIESNELKSHLTALPAVLEYLDLRNNNIGHSGIEHLITLFKDHKKQLLIKLADNRLVPKESLTAICNKAAIKAITTQKRICLTFSGKGKTKDTVESLELSETHSGLAPFQHIQAQDYAQESSPESDNAKKNRLCTNLNNKIITYELFSNAGNVYARPTEPKQKSYSYQWPKINDICLLSNSDQTVAGITTPERSSLFDFKNNNSKDLIGRFRYTNSSKPWKTIGKEFWSLDTPGINYYHERTPFSKNGAMVITVSKAKKCLNIYSNDQLSFDPAQVKLLKMIPESEIKETFNHSIADIKRIAFIDSDKSVKINFTDKTKGELRYILE